MAFKPYLPPIFSLFGGGGDKDKPPKDSDLGQTFQGNPFRSFDASGNIINNTGTPMFDPETGFFTGLQQPGGGIKLPTSRVSTAEKQAAAQTRALIQNLPSILSMFNANIAPNEMAQLMSSLQTSPQYAALAQNIAKSNAMSESGTTLDLLKGSGGQSVLEADKLARQVDPEFYATRANTSNAINQLLQPGLTGGEREEIQRSLNHQNNATGTLTVPTNTSTVANAMTFGKAARDRVSSAVSQATQALPTFRTGVDVFQQATGKPSNTTGFQQGAGQQVFGTGNNVNSTFAGLTGGVNNNKNQMDIAKMQQPDSMDRVMQGLSSVSY